MTGDYAAHGAAAQEFGASFRSTPPCIPVDVFKSSNDPESRHSRQYFPCCESRRSARQVRSRLDLRPNESLRADPLHEILLNLRNNWDEALGLCRVTLPWFYKPSGSHEGLRAQSAVLVSVSKGGEDRCR